MITVRGYESQRIGVRGLGRLFLPAAAALSVAAFVSEAHACAFGSPAPIEATLADAPTIVEGRVESVSYSYLAIIQSRAGGGLIEVSTIRTFKGIKRENWRLEITYQNWPVGDGTEPVWEAGGRYVFPIDEEPPSRLREGDWFGQAMEYIFPPLPTVLVPACHYLPVFLANAEHLSVAMRFTQ